MLRRRNSISDNTAGVRDSRPADIGKRAPVIARRASVRRSGSTTKFSSSCQLRVERGIENGTNERTPNGPWSGAQLLSGIHFSPKHFHYHQLFGIHRRVVVVVIVVNSSSTSGVGRHVPTTAIINAIESCRLPFANRVSQHDCIELQLASD